MRCVKASRHESRPSDRQAEVFAAPRVSGRALFYPRARSDYQAIVKSFSRVLDMVGAGAGDLMLNSFSLGTHPLDPCSATRPAQALGDGASPQGPGPMHRTRSRSSCSSTTGRRCSPASPSTSMHIRPHGPGACTGALDAGVKSRAEQRRAADAGQARPHGGRLGRVLNAYGMLLATSGKSPSFVGPEAADWSTSS